MATVQHRLIFRHPWRQASSSSAPANFFVGDATCAIIDWEDVAIGHPFIGPAPLIVGRTSCRRHCGVR
jgi:hypothetical protein